MYTCTCTQHGIIHHEATVPSATTWIGLNGFMIKWSKLEKTDTT